MRKQFKHKKKTYTNFVSLKLSHTAKKHAKMCKKKTQKKLCVKTAKLNNTGRKNLYNPGL